MNNVFYVYIYLRNIDSNISKAGTPYYIGKGKGKRAWSNARVVPRPKSDENIVIHSKNLSEEDAFRIERELVSKYGRIDISTGILRNRTSGGEGNSGKVYTEEYRRKLSESKRGEKSPRGMLGKHHSQETIEKMSDSQSGEKNHRYGIKLTAEEKKLISDRCKGKQLGKKHTDEHRLHNSLAKRGENHPMFGKKQKIVICPHCGKSGGRTMSRWHFDNCREK